MRRVAHVDGHEHVVGEAVEQHRGISPAPAGVPDAMDAAAFDAHEADAARRLRLGNVVDREPRAPVARALGFRGADGLAERAFVIGALVGEFGGREHVLGVDHQQQVVVRLKMDVPGIGRRGDVIHRARVLGVAHVDDRKALGEHVPDIGKAALHHHLHAVRPAALVAVADDAHVARVIGFRQVGHDVFREADPVLTRVGRFRGMTDDVIYTHPENSARRSSPAWRRRFATDRACGGPPPSSG